MEVELPALLEKYDRLTNRPADRLIDRFTNDIQVHKLDVNRNKCSDRSMEVELTTLQL